MTANAGLFRARSVPKFLMNKDGNIRLEIPDSGNLKSQRYAELYVGGSQPELRVPLGVRGGPVGG
jgi:hypothetical protein